MDTDPHGTEKGVQPLSLLVSHLDMVAVTVLLLKVAPVFREFSAEEIVPSDCLLLFQ